MVGPYWEKLCPLSRVRPSTCGLGPYSRPRAQFFAIRTSRPVYNIYIYNINYIFVHSRSFLVILPNFNLLWILDLAAFGPLFPRIHGLSFLVPSLGWEFEKMMPFLNNSARLEFMSTINVENCTNIWVRVFVILYADCCTDCYYNFNPCGIFDKYVIFSNSHQDLERGKLMAAVNSRK